MCMDVAAQIVGDCCCRRDITSGGFIERKPKFNRSRALARSHTIV